MPWDRVESNHIRFRIFALDDRREGVGSAANFQNLVAWLKLRLIEQCSADRFTTNKLYDRIVKRQQPIMSRRRQISSRTFHDDGNS